MDRAANKAFFLKNCKFEARYKYDICRGISQEHIFRSMELHCYFNSCADETHCLEAILRFPTGLALALQALIMSTKWDFKCLLYLKIPYLLVTDLLSNFNASHAINFKE